MNRLFGKSKPKVAAPTLDDASKSMDARSGTIDEKVKKLDDELLRYKQQLGRMKPSPAKQQLQQRALRVLQQKKMYGKQRDVLYSQQFNIDQAKFAGESIKDNLVTVAAMKDAQKSMKVDMKKMKIDQIEDLHDGQQTHRTARTQLSMPGRRQRASGEREVRRRDGGQRRRDAQPHSRAGVSYSLTLCG